MANHLAASNSPYLLQHADNPVDWYPWGEQALKKARTEDKPIFLSVGYAACHWCHVMAHESFEDTITAAYMNQHFINIKVDREERPDIDQLYMQAVVAITGQGGWPLSVFLTPDGEPFYGGTYFPPTPRFGMPAFREVLERIKQLWEKDRSGLLQSGNQIKNHLRTQLTTGFETRQIDPKVLDKASLALAQNYDWDNGGWGAAPKFPQAQVIEFLLSRSSSGDKLAQEIAIHALKAMARGGMYDVVGGGFARYSTDARWLIPHFEKMLYDNALLARAYLHGFMLTGDSQLRRICEETLEFISRELTHPQGGFFSSLDADSDGVEGEYYLWSFEELQTTITSQGDFRFLSTAYGITRSGNFEGKHVLQRVQSDDELAEAFNMSTEDIPLRLGRLHQELHQVRQKRVPPATDDKILTMWNALAMVTFVEAGWYLKKESYIEMAIRNARFLLSEIYRDGRLLRSWRAGRAQHNAYLEDYAALIQGLLALYQFTHELSWFTKARELTGEMLLHFNDPDFGFFDTRDDHEELILRPKELQDRSVPSGNSLAAFTLLQMAALTGDQTWAEKAASAIGAIQTPMTRHPQAFAQWLCAASFVLAPPQEVAIIGALNHKHTQAFKDVISRRFRPFVMLALSDLPLPPGSPELLHGRKPVNQVPTAYVCQNFTCKLPVTSPEDLASQLGDRG